MTDSDSDDPVVIAAKAAGVDIETLRRFDELWQAVGRELGVLMEFGASLPEREALATQIELSGRLITQGVHLAVHLAVVGDDTLPTQIIALGIEKGTAMAMQCEVDHGVRAPRSKTEN